MEVVLETSIKHEMYGEDHTARNPVESIAYNYDDIETVLEKILEHLAELETKYPGYDNYRYDYKDKAHGMGTYSFWYDLIGIKD